MTFLKKAKGSDPVTPSPPVAVLLYEDVGNAADDEEYGRPHNRTTGMAVLLWMVVG